MSDHHIISGYVGKGGAEVRATKSLAKLVEFSICNNIYKGKEQPALPVWYKVVLWETHNPPLFKFIESYVKQGSALEVTGKDLSIEEYKGKDGSVRHNIVMKPVDISFLPKSKDSGQSRDTQQTASDTAADEEVADVPF